MDNNIVAYFKTRKFWTPFITFLMTVLTAIAPHIGLPIDPQFQLMIITFLWAIASWVVRGDINYDFMREGANTTPTIAAPDPNLPAA